MVAQVEALFADQLSRFDAKHGKELDKYRRCSSYPTQLSKVLIATYAKDDSCDYLTYSHPYPAYFIIRRDYKLAWISATYLNISWRSLSPQILEMYKTELEAPQTRKEMPFYMIYPTLDGLIEHNGMFYTPFDVDDSNYNEILYNGYKQALFKKSNYVYDPSPEARFIDRGDDRRFPMNYASMEETLDLISLSFRQERYADFEEILFRFKYIVSNGDVPKDIMGGPKQRHFAPLMNMYDRWYAARRATDSQARRDAAQEALFWCFESCIRSLGSKNLCYVFSLYDLCQIIGEFDLLGEDQDEFLKYFKRWTMHASISHYERMRQKPVQLATFAEAGMPGFDEFKAICDAWDSKAD